MVQERRKESRIQGAPSEPKRIGIFGASGSGKTTKARKIIAGVNRLIVFDPKEEWIREGRGWLPLFKAVYSIAELRKVLKTCWSKGFQLVYVPPFGQEVAHLNALCTLMYSYQGGYKRDHMAKVTIFVDEAQDGVPSGTARECPTHGALLIARKGRDRGINFVVASQRIKTVDINIRANLSSVYIFRQAELADIQEATQIVHNKKKIQEMANFQYFHKNEKGEIKFFSK